MRKIKVLHITQAVIGGTLEYIKLFFTNIDKEKFDVELVCPAYGPMKDEIEALGFKVYVIDMQREINLIKDFKTYEELKCLIRRVKPDIVHLHSSKAGVLGRLAAYKNKIPNIYNPHGWSFSMVVSNKKKKVYALIEKFCSKYCDYIINISDDEQKLAIKYNISSKDKMKVIYNGIDIKKYETFYDRKKVLNELNIPEDSFIIGMVGRITKQKSPETFIQIASKLKDKIENAYFILVGDGELKFEIEELVKKLNVNDRVRITGWTNQVSKYISIFDVGLLTSKWEGFGLVLAEYMAAQKPVVASDVGGIKNVIINDFNGILVNPDDINGFCDAIIKIKNDNELRKELKCNGYEIVNERFNIKRVVKEHEKLYLDLLVTN